MDAFKISGRIKAELETKICVGVRRMDEEAKVRVVSMRYGKVGCTNFFLRELFFVLFLVAILSSCQKEEVVRCMSPEDVALLVIEYTLTLNQAGAEGLLCHKCAVQPFKGISYEKRLLTDALEKYNVAFDDRNAHDFSDIKCTVSSREGDDIYLTCKGKYILLRRNRTVHEATLIDRNVTLHLEDDRLTICPPVCN